MSDPILFVDRFLEVIFIFHWWEVDILQRRAYLVLNQGCHSQDFQVQVVLTTHSHIFPQGSLCLQARDNPALKVDVYLRTCRTYTPFSKSACTYEPGALPLFQVFGDLRTINISLSSSPVLTNLGYFRSPILLYLRPRTFSGIHVFVQRSVHLWNQWPGMPGRVVEVYAWGDTYFLIRDRSQIG